MLGTTKRNEINMQDSLDYPHSLGIFHSALSQLLGFTYNGDQYKVIGMATYGNAIYMDQQQKVGTLKSNGLFKFCFIVFLFWSKG